ncbi:hypothetical protein ACS0TY_018630 [Phlomoides rotata]
MVGFRCHSYNHEQVDLSDCCDGTAICPNTCVMCGNIVYQGIKYDSTARNLDSINSRKTKLGTEMEDSTYKIIGLKALVFLHVALVIIFMAFRLFRRRKTRRRNSR